jgi:hypothetical protein
MGSGMPDYGLGRCDGHHKMVDFGLRKRLRHAAIGSLLFQPGFVFVFAGLALFGVVFGIFEHAAL